jgi:hypothetical protein
MPTAPHQSYLLRLTTQDPTPMLRHEPHRDATIPDRELGIAAMLLLAVIVLAAVVVPALA